MAPSRRLALEALEARTAPAVFGDLWPNAEYLTLSFAPDGTQISGQASSLFATLNAQEPTAAWQAAILRAVQSWVVNTNLNVGVVPDDGQPFGTPHGGSGGPSFGDIRIGAAPLSPTELAINVPHDPFLSGSWSGDIILNSTINFTAPQTDLYGVLLHEFGHVLGLGPSTDPASVLYQHATKVTTRLAASDVAAVQALYGTPAPNGAHNHTLRTAAPIPYPSGGGTTYAGTTPLMAFGALAAARENDVFSVQSLASYTGPMTFSLQTAGISLLAPELTVYDASGNVLGEAQSTNPLGDVVSVHLDSVTAGATYYVGVQAATSDLFAVGQYGLAVTFDANLTTPPDQIAAMLRAANIDSFGGGFSNGGGSSDAGKPGTIPALKTTRGYAPNQHYEVRDTIDSTATYSLLAPSSPSGAPVVMTVAVSARGGALPQLQVLDTNLQPVAATVLVNDASNYTIQATGLAPGQTYYLQLTGTASGVKKSGSKFSLVADFQQAASLLPELASGSVATHRPQPEYALYVAQDQIFNFTLSAAGVGAPAGSVVQMTITDAAGNVLFTLAAAPGQTVTGPPTLLAPGAYTVRITAVAPAGTAASLTFQLLGASLTDPTGPVIIDPTTTPLYTMPGDPFTYIYPGGTVSVTPFLLVSVAL